MCLAPQSCPTLGDPVDCSLPGSSVHGDSPGKNSGVGCHALLQAIFLTQGSNLGLPLCGQIPYHLSCLGVGRSPLITIVPEGSNFGVTSGQTTNRDGAQPHPPVENWVKVLMHTAHQGSQSVSSVAQSCPTLWDPMNHSPPGLPVHHQLPEFTPTYVQVVSETILPSHPPSSSSPPAPNPFQHQGLFQWVNSSHEVAKLLEIQLQHQSFQWTPRTDLLHDGLVGSPCSPRDSQESSPTPQFKSINFSAISHLHSPTLTSIHDQWKNHSLD